MYERQMRRTARNARAIAAKVEALLARAVIKLTAGEPIAAQRAVCAAAEIAALDARLRRHAEAEARERERLAERERAVAAREHEVEAQRDDIRHRELKLEREAKQVEEMRTSVETLYALMYTKGADETDETTLPENGTAHAPEAPLP